MDRPADTTMPMNASTWAQLILLGAIWGGSFFFVRIAVLEIQPLILVFLRVAIAAAALHVYLAAVGPSFRLAFRLWRPLLLLALLNNVIPFSLIFFGQTVLGAGLASVLNATTPLWTLIIANAMTRDEKLTAPKLVGIVLGIAGTAIMIGPGLLAGMDGPIWPKFALIGASISYAFALMTARRLRQLPPPIIATGQLTASTAIMLPVALSVYARGGAVGGSPQAWAAVLALALLSTAFAYLLFFRIVARSGATNASLVTLIVPVSAILLGVGLLGERLDLYETAGMAVIFCGLLAIDSRLFRKIRKSRQ